MVKPWTKLRIAMLSAVTLLGGLIGWQRFGNPPRDIAVFIQELSPHVQNLTTKAADWLGKAWNGAMLFWGDGAAVGKKIAEVATTSPIGVLIGIWLKSEKKKSSKESPTVSSEVSRIQIPVHMSVFLLQHPNPDELQDVENFKKDVRSALAHQYPRLERRLEEIIPLIQQGLRQEAVQKIDEATS